MEIKHKVGAGEHGTYDLSLNANSTPVNDSDGFEAEAPGFGEIFFYNGGNIAGRDGVEIEDVGQRNPQGFVFHTGLKNKNPASPRGPTGSKPLRAPDVQATC